MSYNFQNIKILLVDDNEPMLEIIESILEMFGISHIIKANNIEMGYREFWGTESFVIITPI
jgi:CheY-like chemotaxis protein